MHLMRCETLNTPHVAEAAPPSTARRDGPVAASLEPHAAVRVTDAASRVPPLDPADTEGGSP